MLKPEVIFKNKELLTSRAVSNVNQTIHPAWRAFMEFCSELSHGEIEILKIQDGLPVLAETVKKKIKFMR
jgi:hypothetical protein